MNLRQLYNDAILEQQHSLILLLDFLIFEKQVLNFNSHISELDLYFKPNNKKRMNMLLQEYKESREGESVIEHPSEVIDHEQENNYNRVS